MEINKLGFSTQAIHAGEFPDPNTGASAPNIVMSTTFVTDIETDFSAQGQEDGDSWVYSRWGNPSVKQLEDKLAVLEEAETGVAFASGMGAISVLLFHLLKAGDHAVVSDIAYAALAEMTNDTIPSLGIEVTKVDMTNLQSLKNELKPNTKLVYIESPCNPILRLTDIAAVAEITHAAGAKLAIDSTFATPAATKPILLGADFVIHSLTKYLGGHGDALGGIILGKKEDINPLRKKTAVRLGGTLSPFNAWLIMRGLATFPIRMKAHEENAMKIASFLESHPKVKRVIYPGLESHPQYELAKRQMKNFSGIISFQVENGEKNLKEFVNRLQIIHYAVSLGHHRTLIFYIPSKDLLENTFQLKTEEQLASWYEFAGEGVFRFSIGLEDADDLIKELEWALEVF